MTTIFSEKIKCAACGSVSHHNMIGSTNSMGAPDLDLRPPQMKRSTMSMWVQECPACGYVSYDISKCNKDIPQYIKSEEYRSCEGKEFMSDLAKRFYKFYLICKKTGKTESAFSAALDAAWACDDCHDKKNATACREIAISLITELLNADKDMNENYLLIKADLMRRAGHFDEVINEYQTLQFSNETLNRIVKFQIKKASEKDDSCYTVSDATRTIQ